MTQFWKDSATISRQENVVLENGFTENQLVEVYQEIACHLSVTRNSFVQNNGQATTMGYAYKLFCDPSVIIYPNDVIEVTTRIGKKYKLYAGLSTNYDKTCQTSLSFTPTANEVY